MFHICYNSLQFTIYSQFCNNSETHFTTQKMRCGPSAKTDLRTQKSLFGRHRQRADEKMIIFAKSRV